MLSTCEVLYKRVEETGCGGKGEGIEKRRFCHYDCVYRRQKQKHLLYIINRNVIVFDGTGSCKRVQPTQVQKLKSSFCAIHHYCAGFIVFFLKFSFSCIPGHFCSYHFCIDVKHWD